MVSSVFPSISVAALSASLTVLPCPLATAQQADENEVWRQRLTTPAQDAQWFVGARLGTELSALPGEEAFAILEKNWPQIAASVRKQILKGYGPAFNKRSEVNEHYFEVMHLGMTDSNSGVRQFAASYISWLTFHDFEQQPAMYEPWRAANASRPARQVCLEESRRFLTTLGESDQARTPEAARILGQAATTMREFDALREAALEEGLLELIADWVEAAPDRATMDHLAHVLLQLHASDQVELDEDYLARVAALDLSAITGKPPVARQPAEAMVADNYLRAGADVNKQYFLMAPQNPLAMPLHGYKLVLVLPGGDGSASFQPFVSRIYQRSVPSDEFLMAQLVAPQWAPEQAETIVWPTVKSPWPGMKFSTEQFIDDVIDDIAQRYRIDRRFIFTLSWSSGGPAAYAASLCEQTPITGSLVAMSVFKPQQLPALANAKGQAYYILHSPQDFIAMRFPEAARDQLAEHGGHTQLVTYPGGHGWRGDVFGNIRAGIDWLVETVAELEEE